MKKSRQVTYSQHPNHAARQAHKQGDRQFRHYDTSYIRPKRSKLPLVFGAILAVLALAIGAGLMVNLMGGTSDEPSTLLASGAEVTVEIPEGSSAKQIGDILCEAGVVKSASDFTQAADAANATSGLQAGTYVITGEMSLDDIVSLIVKGNAVVGVTLTIPEGYTLKAIAAAVETATKGRITAEDLLEQASDASVYAKDFSFLEEAGDNSLEGFLFPKTYTVAQDATADDVVRMMLEQFRIETASLDLTYPESRDMSLYDVVKLSSIVEKESTPSTAAQVASVFYNRLNTDYWTGLLESDATTAYSVGHDPSSDEVHDEDDPYSTYVNAGLPPTPICSPGLEVMKAVCSPDMDYIETPDNDGMYYFLFYDDAEGNIQYVFSQYYEEHEAAIAEYL